MITISDGILTIPEGERFVGFTGDNRHTQKKFFIRQTPESGWLYRLYLTFDDGRQNFFLLPATLTQEGTILEWSVQEDHISKSGLVRAQIKAFSEDNEVYHTTSDVFIAGKTAEEDEYFKNSNSEFLAYEKTLNDLYKKMRNASAKMPYVGENGNWFCYDEKTDSYKDTGIESIAGIKDKSITPSKLDRTYWERRTSVETQITRADDLFDATGFIGDGGSIAFLNVNTTVNISEDDVELANINGFCYAVGVKFVNGDTVYLLNVTDGTQWKINRYNEGSELVPVYKLQCFRLGVSDGTITPEKLDRKYLERCVTEYGETISTFAELFDKVGRINRGGSVGFVKLYVSDNENDTVQNYGYINGDFMAVGTPTNSDICLIDLRNGENWTVTENDEGKYIAYKVDVITPRVDYLTNAVGNLQNYITPQMFGAKADGETDDTNAVQEALNQGGVVYFPRGGYKVTSPLTATKPCKIVMEGFYPSSYDGGDYPTADYSTKYGARIETYANGIGLLLGDSAEADGLAIRAMEGFSGVILKYDGSKGVKTYPSQVRLKHIRVDRENIAGAVVESFFDFNPYKTYGVIVDDVILGSNHIAQFCEYGFRCSLTQWATSIRLSNIVVDTYSHYPFYVKSNGHIATNWVIQNLAVQTYAFTQSWCKGLIENHINGVFISGIEELLITGSKLWDVHTNAFTGAVVEYEELGVSSKITAIGNDSYFNSIDTEGNKLNIVSLTSSVTANEATGGNTINLSDGEHNHKIELPAVSLTDEQVGNAVGDWMVENAAPTEVIGKNKLNPAEAENGGLNASGLENSGDTAYYWRTGSIEVKKGDTVRFIYNTGTAVGLRNMYMMYEYDENMNFISRDTAVASSYVINNENTKYFRAVISKSGSYGIPYENSAQCMITVNSTDTGWEDYRVILEGGIGQYLVLVSPNGTKYTVSVSDSGVLSATPV